jgi:hypothetical protein
MLFHIYETFLVYYAIFHLENTANPFYNHAYDHFIMMLTNCDSNMYSHIPYKRLQDWD